MAHTPPHLRGHRGIGTLIGNGWLREKPENLVPPEWRHLKGKSAMRKCQLLPAVGKGPVAGGLLPAPKRKDAAEIHVHRQNPRNDVRMMPAFNAAPIVSRHLTPRSGAIADRKWWDDPVAVGSLLILCPPVGLAAIWSSRRYSNDARWALTVMTGLMMCLLTTVVIVAMVAR